MSDPRPFDTERKLASRAATAASALADALKVCSKAHQSLETEAPQAIEALGVAGKSLAVLRTLIPTLEGLDAELQVYRASAEQAFERSKARLVAELDAALRERGHQLSGRLPRLGCGPLTLELSTSKRAEVKVFYGPGIELLDKVAFDAKKVSACVVEQLASLEGQGLDDPAFLGELRAAWHCALARSGAPDGERAPIVDVLAELAAGRQSKSWRANPTRSGFKGYSRVQFSHDLGRLRSRRLDGEELALTVATRDQTRKATDHLWVSGTHYAYLAFRR